MIDAILSYLAANLPADILSVFVVKKEVILLGAVGLVLLSNPKALFENWRIPVAHVAVASVIMWFGPFALIDEVHKKQTEIEKISLAAQEKTKEVVKIAEDARNYANLQIDKSLTESTPKNKREFLALAIYRNSLARFAAQSIPDREKREAKLSELKEEELSLKAQIKREENH